METVITNAVNKLRYIREQNQLTQHELSKMSGVSISTLTKLETGIIKNPSFLLILKLSKALEISLDELMDNQTDIENYESNTFSKSIY